jgi:hypothetical protein
MYPPASLIDEGECEAWMKSCPQGGILGDRTSRAHLLAKVGGQGRRRFDTVHRIEFDGFQGPSFEIRLSFPVCLLAAISGSLRTEVRDRCCERIVHGSESSLAGALLTPSLPQSPTICTESFLCATWCKRPPAVAVTETLTPEIIANRHARWS